MNYLLIAAVGAMALFFCKIFILPSIKSQLGLTKAMEKDGFGAAVSIRGVKFDSSACPPPRRLSCDRGYLCGKHFYKTSNHGYKVKINMDGSIVDANNGKIGHLSNHLVSMSGSRSKCIGIMELNNKAYEYMIPQNIHWDDSPMDGSPDITFRERGKKGAAWDANNKWKKCRGNTGFSNCRI